jgi:hypothetical protein
MLISRVLARASTSSFLAGEAAQQGLDQVVDEAG